MVLTLATYVFVGLGWSLLYLRLWRRAQRRAIPPHHIRCIWSHLPADPPPRAPLPRDSPRGRAPEAGPVPLRLFARRR